MNSKKKVCAGCNVEQFIYKNIDGKKYCKPCAYKLQPPKAIPKMTKKQAFKIKLKWKVFEEDKEFYLKVWYERFGRVEGTSDANYFGIDNATKMPKCECCGKRLWFEPNIMFFHHILEKRNYPELRHETRNIAVICADCHNRYEAYPGTVPYLINLKEERKAEFDFKNKLLDSRHTIQRIQKILNR